MHEQRTQDLETFVAWAKEHIQGDEKGEAQVFLDRLFAAFGRKGVKEAGATLELRVKKADNRGTAFADLVWKPVVLVEMKRRGEDLSRHYRQAFDYWTRIVPGRPRYVVLCNFDEFWVYDFETQMDSPVDQLPLAELPKRWGPLAFLFPTDERPVFGNDHEAVTRAAADRLAACFGKLVARKVDRGTAQRFVLQALVALFSEDIGLLAPYTVSRLLEDCHKPADSFDLLGGLFEAMNTPGGAKGGRFKGVEYFNGGLFAVPARLELHPDEIAQLRQAARSDWSQVRPEIFGVLFEHSMDQEERHAFGAHFTSPVDIMKIVGPTIVEPWRREIEAAGSVRRLNELLHRMHDFRVLDPACGSGNFLYIAYREMKRLEARIFERITELSKKADAAQRRFGFVTAANFYGIDVNPFAVELAKVTMMIARKLAIDELHVTEPALPLDNLDGNFTAGDALVDEGGNPRAWPAADAIIGNPPFIGAKRLKPWHGPDYVNRIRKLYPDVPGMADYCVYWLRKAHDHLPPCTPADPVAGRAGLVGTQNVRNNQSRVGGLDYVVKTGTIIEAVDNQPWSGEANVHVSIVNWVKSQDPAVLPGKRTIWHKVDPSLAVFGVEPAARGRRQTVTPGKRKGTRKDKSYELAFRECEEINSALSDQTDVSAAKALDCNTRPQRCFNGQMLGHRGFLLTAADRAEIMRKDPTSAQVIHPYLNGLDAVTGARFNRYVLDFEQLTQLDAAAFPGAFQWVKVNVLPDRERKANEGVDADGNLRPHHKAFLARWWQLSFGRPEMLSVIKPLPRYLACAYVTKRPIFMFVSSSIRPSNLIQVFGFADDFSFGIFQSHAHWIWFITKCGKLTERFRYSAESVFDTFPWPQSPTVKQIDAVAEAGREVRRVRAEALNKVRGGLRAVYRTLELPGNNPLKDAHAALDAAVLAAYGFSPKKDLLGQLLALNLDVAARIDAGQPVTAPGVPPGHPEPARLVTPDCIRADG